MCGIHITNLTKSYLDTNMGLKTVDLAAILLNLVYCAYSEHILPCNVTSLETSCTGANQVCSEITHQCECKTGFTFVGDNCEAPSPDDSNHTLTAAVVTIFTIALLACGIVLVFRKYNLLTYIRLKYNVRRNNNATYEDVMIGQDDPPLSP